MADQQEPSGAQKITHLAFYAGWPRAMSATAVAQQVFGATSEEN